MSDWWSADPVAGGTPSAPAAGRSPTRIEVRPIDPRSRDLAIRTIYGEAAQEPPEGQAAVAAVIKNRLDSGRFGPGIPSVVLARNQFEPWSTPAGRSRMLGLSADHPAYQAIGDIVDRVFGGEMDDPTQGATHFFSPGAQAALGREPPRWAQGDGLAIGRHTFYAPEGRVGAMSDVSAQSRQPASAAAPTRVGMAPDSAPTPKADDAWWSADPVAEKPREAQGPPVPDIGRSGALGAGLRAGAMLNWNDELAGLRAAGGGLIPEAVQQAAPATSFVVAPAVGAGRLAYEYLTGKQGAGANAYEQARDIERQQIATARQQYPGTTLAGELAGSVAVPIPGAAGAGLGTRIAASAATGAIGGAGAGDTAQERAIGAATGGALGGAVAAAAPAVASAAGAVGKLASAPIAMVRGAANPETEAARRVASAIERDRGIGAAGLSEAEFAAAHSAGAPVAAIDLGGAATRSLGRSAANTSPEGRAALERLTQDRFAGQSERVADALTGLVRTPANATVTREALEQAAQTSRKPFYDRAYKAGSNGVWDDELYQLVNSTPVLKPILEEANKSIQTKMITGRAQQPLSPNGTPTLEYWDQVKRTLDSKINVAYRQGDKELAGDLGAIRSTLIQKLDAAVPEYQTARGVAASFFKADDALSAGEKFVTGNFNLAATRQALGKMTPEERDLFAEGFVSKYREKLLAIGDNRNVLNQIANTPAARAKIDMVLGQNGTEKVEAALRVERVMDQARGMLQNSTTVRQWIEAGLAGGAVGYLTGGDITSFAGGAAALRGGSKVLGQYVDKRVAQKVAELLTSNDTAKVQQALSTIAQKPSLLRALRSLDNRLGRAAGQQSGSVPALQSMGTGRAESDNPNVPGP